MQEQRGLFKSFKSCLTAKINKVLPEKDRALYFSETKDKTEMKNSYWQFVDDTLGEY